MVRVELAERDRGPERAPDDPGRGQAQLLDQRREVGDVLPPGSDRPRVADHDHPLARGVELAAEVIDSPQAVIGQQVAAGVVVRMAVLYELLAGRPPFRGATPLETLELVRTRLPDPPAGPTWPTADGDLRPFPRPAPAGTIEVGVDDDRSPAWTTTTR